MNFSAHCSVIIFSCSCYVWFWSWHWLVQRTHVTFPRFNAWKKVSKPTLCRWQKWFVITARNTT